MLICFPVLLGLPTTQEVGRTGVLIALFRDIELFVPQTVKNLSAVQEIWVPSLGQKDPLEKGMATHCNILAWRITWTEERILLNSPWGRKELERTEQLTL